MDAEEPTHAGIRTLKPFTGYKMCVSLFGKQASLVYNHQNKNIRLQIVSGVERDRGGEEERLQRYTRCQATKGEQSIAKRGGGRESRSKDEG